MSFLVSVQSNDSVKTKLSWLKCDQKPDIRAKVKREGREVEMRGSSRRPILTLLFRKPVLIVVI